MGTAEPPDPTPLVEAVAGLLKFSIIYAPDHPRVVDRASAFAAQIARWREPSRWLVVRVHNDAPLVGSRPCKGKGPLIAWLVTRMREAGLAGVQFGPDVEVSAAIEFARALASCNVRSGRGFADLWPLEHPSIRPLDLVFKGTHSDLGPTGAAAARVPGQADLPSDDPGPNGGAGTGDAPVGPAEQRQQALVARLYECPAVVQQIAAIEQACSGDARNADAAAACDILTLVVQQLPLEVLGDDARLEQVVTQALAALQSNLDRLLRENAEVVDADLTRRAMSLARRYFSKEVSASGSSRDLPTGRPGDERISADLRALLQEIGRLPARPVSLPPAANLIASAPDMAAELGGICLNLAIAGQRPQTRALLQRQLPGLLDALGPGRLQLFDSYLKPVPKGKSALGDVERLRLLGVLAEGGGADLILDRGYCDPQFVARTFPDCLPALVPGLARSPRGLAMLRSSIAAVPPARVIEGAEALRLRGALREPRLVAAIVAIGGPRVVPLLRRAIDAPEHGLRTLVVEHLRSLGLPDAEAAALRCVESPADLPVGYLDDLCRMIEEGRSDDPDARQRSARILREMLVDRWGALGHERRLIAISGLRHLPSTENIALLRGLARTGQFTQFGKEARALRQRARDALQWMDARRGLR